MTSAVAARYARALADAVLAPGSGLEPVQAVAQLTAVEALMQESSELRHALSSPAVRPPNKRRVIDDLAGRSGLSRLIRNFLFVLVDHHRFAVLPDIREAFETEIDQRLGFVRAEVASAQSLDGEQTRAIEAGLTTLTGKQVRARFHVDPALIGGVVARIGSTVYDGSLRGQLESMRRQIAQHTAAGI
jgi:F-type H+-transporting ATPase subunit delta